jgi:hypothetical protein
LEIKLLEFAHEHADVWQTFVIKPAAVFTRRWPARGLLTAIIGKNHSIKNEEVGAYVAELAVKGQEMEKEGLIFNPTMVEKGRELLEKRS